MTEILFKRCSIGAFDCQTSCALALQRLLLICNRDVFLQHWSWEASLDRLIAPSFGWAAACQRSSLLSMPSLEVLLCILDQLCIVIALESVSAYLQALAQFIGHGLCQTQACARVSSLTPAR